MTQTTRFAAIDLLRGLVMILMALDHVRDYFHNDAFIHDPLDLNTTTPALFFTRWITHFCAPVFVFLAGISAYLAGIKRNGNELQQFLIKRGLWLVLIEITVVSFGWQFNPYINMMVLQVIWAIGISMFLLGVMVKLPRNIILISGILIITLHNLLDLLPTTSQETIWYNLLHTSGFRQFPVTAGTNLLTVYGFLPWLGIMLLGYGMGYLFTPSFTSEKRNRVLLSIGTGMILLFIALRWINGYGNPQSFTAQKNFVFTLMAFVDVSKYPPSLMYTCMTLGPALLLLVYLEKIKTGKILEPVRVIGNVPFFYYITHIYLIHLLAIVVFFAQGYGTGDIIQQPFWFRPNTMGFGLAGVYAAWVLVMILLYPLCTRFARYKLQRKYWWISYL